MAPEAQPCSIWVIWNARSLGHSVEEARRRKMDFVRALVKRAQIMILQEMHLPTVSMRRAMREFDTTHWLESSGESDSSGGAAIMISKKICKQRPMRVEHVLGRILQVTCSVAEGRLDVFVIHNFGIGNQEMRRFIVVLRECSERHRGAPHMCRAVLMGDLNFGPAYGGGASTTRQRGDRALDAALCEWVELPTGVATHINAANGGCSCIDRVWTLLPRSLPATAWPRAAVRVQPERIFADGLSDHSPVEVAWPDAFQLPAKHWPIPRGSDNADTSANDAGGDWPQREQVCTSSGGKVGPTQSFVA